MYWRHVMYWKHVLTRFSKSPKFWLILPTLNYFFASLHNFVDFMMPDHFSKFRENHQTADSPRGVLKTSQRSKMELFAKQLVF